MADEPAITGDNRNPDGTFKDGTSGNPNGRPPGSISIIGIIKKKLQEVPKGQMKELGELMAEQILELAYVKGDVTLLKEIVHYIDGMPNQKIDFGVDKENIGELTDFLTAMAKKKPKAKVEKEPEPKEDGGDKQPDGGGAQ